MQIGNQLSTEERVMATVAEGILEEDGQQLIETEDKELGEKEINSGKDSPIVTGVSNYLTTMGEWEIEEAKPLQVQQQHAIVCKEREISLWVKQNMIKLGEVLGADFRSHEEKALELLLQVDSSRHARKMENEIVFKKLRFRGMQELKSLVSFDVKFKNNGCKN